MAKQILFDENARKKVLRGVETLAKAERSHANRFQRALDSLDSWAAKFG